MDNKKYIICGDAQLPQLDTKEEDTIRFHIDGADDDFRIMLEIENIRDNVYKDVPSRFRDLLDIATYVFAADQAVVRGANDVETFGSSWRRRFHFVIPVADLDFWSSESVQSCLRETLSFLSDDYYEFDFVQTAGRPLLQGFFKNLNDNGELFGFPEQIIMFSGGIDSLGGAVEEIINQKRRVILVNHRSTEKMDKRYQTIRELIDKKAPDNLPSHIRVTVNKKKWMNKEYTQRSRSFLYMTIGATIANMIGQSNVRFYENGVISLNLPICAQVVGGKATRTTHPRVFSGFQRLLTMVADKPFLVENPFEWKTKAEVVELIVRSGCPELIEPSISCTHTWEMTKLHSHCGACSQCVDRRFAILAAKAESFDADAHYAVDVFTERRESNEKVHEDKTLFANYLERANQVVNVSTATQFLAKYPEVARALPYLKGDPGSSAQRCFDLYKRHAAEVNLVVDRMFAKHGTAIRQRTIHADSLMRIVFESALPTTAPVTSANVEEMADNVFRREGFAWKARFKGRKPFTVLPWLGASYLHYLLVLPGTKRPAIDMVCGTAIEICDQAISAQDAIDAGLQCQSNPALRGIGEVSDRQAVSEYRAEAIELLSKIEMARAQNDNVLELQCEQDIAMIVSRINEAVGMGGKLKMAKDKRKNIRDSFRSNVNRVIEKQIRAADSAFADHLVSQLQFGNTPIYVPEGVANWDTSPILND